MTTTATSAVLVRSPEVVLGELGLSARALCEIYVLGRREVAAVRLAQGELDLAALAPERPR